MSVGSPITKAQLDGQSGSLIIEFENALNRIKRFSDYLAATSDPTLTALGYSAGEIAILRSAYVTDLGALFAIYAGTQNLAVARDFRTFGHQLWGTGI
jgi:hypothetical protein